MKISGRTMLAIIGLASLAQSASRSRSRSRAVRAEILASDELRMAYLRLGLPVDTHMCPYEDPTKYPTTDRKAIESAYRKASKHKGGSTEKFNEIHEAYALIMRKLGRAIPDLGLDSDGEECPRPRPHASRWYAGRVDVSPRIGARAAGEKRRVYRQLVDERKEIAKKLTALAGQGRPAVAETEECCSRLGRISSELAKLGGQEPGAVTY